MEALLRKYNDPRQVRVGDVVILDSDSLSPFSTSIVTGIEDLSVKYPLVHLGRVHARCESHKVNGHGRGEQVAVMVETYSVEAHRFIQIYSVFVNGSKGQIDNRNGIYTRELVAERNVSSEAIEDRDLDQQ